MNHQYVEVCEVCGSPDVFKEYDEVDLYQDQEQEQDQEQDEEAEE